ncbi:DUF262 domain-containing protein [Aquibaculum sediminis]|uniref:DUF262 domain-containing protein n=1 Tax=Aquibaculum sediminis TaxID=3231907 RepID=UPI0034569A17
MKESASLAENFNRAQSKLVIQTADLPLGTLANMVEEGSIDLSPGFQRRERWKQEDQSALIESFLLNVPVPPIYLSEEDDGKYTAIDGKQRLKAIADFMSGRIALRGLESLVQAEGKYFNDMPSEIYNALRLRPFLRVVTLLKQTNEHLKYEVFLRLNRGGESLNQQEIRNVAFRGAMNDAIYECAKNTFLRKQLKITSEKSQSYRQMQDAEFVLRFLALSVDLAHFRGSLIRQMDTFMLKHENTDKKSAFNISNSFNIAIARVEEIWGERAFQRPDGLGWRDQLLAGLYDAQMLASWRLEEKEFISVCSRRKHIVEKTRQLFSDKEFDKSVRTGTNTPARIRYRVTKTYETLLSEVN